MTLPYTSLFVCVFILLQIILTFRTIAARSRQRILIGDAGDELMLQRIRSHANFTEIVPLCVFAIALNELQGAHHYMVISLYFALLLGRILHPLGMELPKQLILRQIGMVLSLGAMLISAIHLGVLFAF